MAEAIKGAKTSARKLFRARDKGTEEQQYKLEQQEREIAAAGAWPGPALGVAEPGRAWALIK